MENYEFIQSDELIDEEKYDYENNVIDEYNLKEESQEFRKNIADLDLEKVMLKGKIGYYTKERINSLSIPHTYSLYELRSNGKNYDEPLSIENSVINNFCGSFITKKGNLKIVCDETIKVDTTNLEDKIDYSGLMYRLNKNDFKLVN